MNSCRCWSENRHESSWNWLYLIFIDWFTRYVDTGEDFIYIYDSIWISFDSDWFQNKFEREIIFEFSFICFSFALRKCIAYEKAIWIHQKFCFFLKDSENKNQNQKAIWIWIFQMDSENVFLTKRPSESEFFRWIRNLYSLLKGCLNPSESEFFRWIQKLYSWPKGHLNPSESEFFGWIEKMYILVKGSLESIWHWKFFHGYRKEILSFETTGKHVGGFDRSCFLLNDHLNPI